jgi:hypothetical protein
MAKKLSSRMGLENRGNERAGQKAGFASVVRNAFGFNHHADSPFSRIATAVSRINSDFATMRQAEVVLGRTRMLR